MQSMVVSASMLDVQSVTDMVSLKEGTNVFIRCAIQFDTLKLDSLVVEHLAHIQGAWVQSSVWPLFSGCCFNIVLVNKVLQL